MLKLKCNWVKTGNIKETVKWASYEIPVIEPVNHSWWSVTELLGLAKMCQRAGITCLFTFPLNWFRSDCSDKQKHRQWRLDKEVDWSNYIRMFPG